MTDEEYQAKQDAEDAETLAAMKCDAKLLLRNAAQWTEEGKLEIAEWLRHQAEMLLTDGHEYAELFTARYRPEEGSEE